LDGFLLAYAPVSIGQRRIVRDHLPDAMLGELTLNPRDLLIGRESVKFDAPFKQEFPPA
jgi:hypothetical protein